MRRSNIMIQAVMMFSPSKHHLLANAKILQATSAAFSCFYDSPGTDLMFILFFVSSTTLIEATSLLVPFLSSDSYAVSFTMKYVCLLLCIVPCELKWLITKFRKHLKRNSLGEASVRTSLVLSKDGWATKRTFCFHPLEKWKSRGRVKGLHGKEEGKRMIPEGW